MANHAHVTFNSNHDGVSTIRDSKVNISYRGEGFAPYELFLSGYAACLHATFLGIAKKKRLTFTDVSYNVEGHKREEVPTLLNYVKTVITFTGVTEDKQQSVIKSMELAEKYCSISAMIKGIADMEFEYNFN